MIYLDSSVALAYLLAEDRYPTNALWDQPIGSSRLLESAIWIASIRPLSARPLIDRVVRFGYSS